MNVIENFAELSFEEQKKFAEALVKTINSENTFTDETNFIISGIEVDEFSGGLVILIEHNDLISVSREATWQCLYEDEVDADPRDTADYAKSIYSEAEKAFKTLSTEIDGYTVSLQVDDIDEKETIEVNVDDYSHEDGGVGDFDHFGFTGNDSRPYIEVEGTIVKGCDCALSLYVELADEPVTETEEEI